MEDTKIQQKSQRYATILTLQFLQLQSKFLNHKFYQIVDQWQEKRKRYIQSKYIRMLQKEGNASNTNLEPLGSKSVKDQNQKTASKKTFAQTKQDLQRRSKIAENKAKEAERKAKYLERQEAFKKYNTKKAERYKVLRKKTTKGQPLMAGRIEMLLEKIKETCD